MSLPLERRLRAALDEECARRSAEIARLLEARGRLEPWSGLELDDASAAEFRRRRAGIAEGLLELLFDWTRRGGAVTLEVPSGVSGELPPLELPSLPPRPALLSALESGPPARLELPRLATFPTPAVPPPTARSVDAENGASPFDGEEPREEPAATSQEPPTPATPAALERLKSFIESGGALRGTSRPAPWRPTLEKLMNRLVPVDRDEEELERLVAAGPDREEWKILPQDVQRHVLGLVACRLRVLQDERGHVSARLDDCFSQLTQFSATERPGFVWGLSRAHTPERRTWDDDADAHWEALSALLPRGEHTEPNQEKKLARIQELLLEIERAPEVAREAVRSQAVRSVREALEIGVSSRDPRLVRMVGPLEEHLLGRSFRTLRRAIREQREVGDSEPDDDTGPLPDDWGWWGHTRGRRAIMVGGSPREPNRARLEEAFEFASLEWVPSEHGRNSLVTVRDRVRAGKVDLVLILTRFVGHNADDIILPACRESGTAWASVEHGYGVLRIRHALERFLEPRAVAVEPGPEA